MPELGFLRGETGAGNSQNREPSAHCLGESENSKGLLEGGIAVGDVSLQALARCSISSSRACRGPGGSWSPQCSPVPAASVASLQLRDGPTWTPSPKGKQELPGGCTCSSQSLLERDTDGEQTSGVSSVHPRAQPLLCLSLGSFLWFAKFFIGLLVAWVE